jgi:hypothetical protein
MPYNLMIRDGLKVWLYETEDFICFGTPRDIELLKAWKTILAHAEIATPEELKAAYEYWEKHLC